jgi:hypothetical protein
VECGLSDGFRAREKGRERDRLEKQSQKTCKWDEVEVSEGAYISCETYSLYWLNVDTICTFCLRNFSLW